MKKFKKFEKYFVFDQPVSENKILCLAKEITMSRFLRMGPPISSAKLAKDFLSHQIDGNEREIFTVTFLDTRHRIIAHEELFFGTIDCAAVYPREIVKRVLFHNAAAVILAHNHPSGDPTPSPHDHTITKRIRDALALVGARLLDHLILAGPEWFSFAENELL